MGRFFNGLLIGAGIGLLIAPMRGEDMRRLVGERVKSLQNSLPSSGSGSQYIQQVSDQVSQAASTLKDHAQQAATRVQSTGSQLGDIAQRAGTEVKQTSQDVAKTTKQTARSAKPDTRGSTTSF